MEEENDSPDIPPIQKGDKLFVEDHEMVRIVESTEYAHKDFKTAHFFTYANGYKRAGDKLVQIFSENRSPDSIPFALMCVDLVFPIIFLYRQYLELILKDLILIGEQVPRTQAPRKEDNLFKTHSFDQLWQRFSRLLEQISPPETPQEEEEREAVRACIMEFHGIDPNGDVFRYPVSQRNQPSFKDKEDMRQLRYINVSHLAEKMESLGIFFMQVELSFIAHHPL